MDTQKTYDTEVRCTVVYSKPGCPQCTATERAMTAAGIEHQTVDISVDDEAHAYVQALGYAQAPVVIAAGGADRWSGFQPDRIAALAEQHLPPLDTCSLAGIN